jgi:transcriptional regulator with XRE-family HTH domain
MVQLKTPEIVHGQKFVTMSIHIGEAIRAKLSASGMTDQAFAERVGMHRNSVQRVLSKPSIDTMMLTSISKVLATDFFVLLSADLGRKSAKGEVADPSASYLTKDGHRTMRVIIEMDADDVDAKDNAVDLIKRIRSKK